MPFKPLSHLARISFAKGVAHAYTPGAVVAGQQGLGSLHSYPVAKLGKATHIQNAFSTASNSGAGAGAGAKAGYASTSSNGDGSLSQYFAAFNKAQQTGDDSELKKHQGARRIGWKQDEKTSASKSAARLDIKPTDILRQPPRVLTNRGYSDNAAQDIEKAKDNLVEAEALAKIDEAIALEIKSINDAKIAEAAAGSEYIEVAKTDDSAVSDTSNAVRSPSAGLSSPVSDESSLRSDEIVELGENLRYTDIPYQFQSMVKDGLVPNVHAYNYIIQSAINLAGGYQPFPRAVEVFNDMTAKGIQPNEETYRILVAFLSSQSLLASQAQKELRKHNLRYGYGQASFIFPSLQHKQELFAEDISILMATKFYNIARQELQGFRLSDAQYSVFLEAYESSGHASSMAALGKDMHAQQLFSSPENCIAAINACAQVKDLSTAKSIYQQYRNIAMNDQTNDLLDTKAYTALVKAYYAAGEQAEGLRFFERILSSFEDAPNQKELVQTLTDAFVTDGVVEHYVSAGDMHEALESLKTHNLSEQARSRAISKILSAAADNNQTEVVKDVITSVSGSSIETDAVIAVAAMHFRAGEVVQAKTFWAQHQRLADVSFTTMFGLSVLQTGNADDALSNVLNMFRQIRTSISEGSRAVVHGSLDESVLLFGQALSSTEMIYSSHAAVLLFRLMIENGGLVPYITQAAIARVGPECVQQLSNQDIALALHVQAYMLPSQNRTINDVAQPARFAHLLETVLDRRIAMDPATVHAVDNALAKLEGRRPDLERRWTAWRSPETALPQQQSPALSSTSVRDTPSMYDPYSNTTDHRASRVISDLLDNTSGRIENHLSEAMTRLKNVRRMGRHLQYAAYAKLITAAGKAKQSTLIHELLAMAQTDVPYNASIAAVRNGWVSIYDSMIAACLSVGQRQVATKFHDELLSMGAAPSANTFGIYITTLEGTFDEATEAVKIFQRAVAESVTPTVFLFNAVIGKLGKARRIDDCLQYFGQMQNLGIRPSSVTYGTLVNALCRTSEETFAVEMFDEMEAAPNYRPRPAPYNSIIQYFLNTKRDRAKVLQYYGRMRSRDIKPTSHTYKLLIEAYATLEPVNLPAAETVLEDMKANGVMPEAVHYGTLIHAKGCVLSDMEGARMIFDRVLADSSVRPTDNLYQNMLEAMVANLQVADGDAVLKDMQQRGIAITPYIANTLIHGWASAGSIDKAKNIYDTIGKDKREPSTYEAMTRAFMMAGNHAAADTVVQEMLTKGYPNAVVDKVLGLVGSS